MEEIKEHMQNCIDREESCLLNTDNTKKLLEEIERLNKEKELLQYDLDNANSKLRDSMAIRLKAIEYLTECNKSDLKFTSRTYDILLNILKGSDKE